MNINSTEASNLNIILFSLSLIEWFNIQNYFVAYALPIIILLSIFSNAIILKIFCSKRTVTNIASNARFYYIAIAIVDLGTLLLYHIPENFLLVGAKVLFHFWSFTLSVQSNTACKIYAAVTHFCPHCIGWIYLLFDIERLMIIFDPLRSLDERKVQIYTWIGLATIVVVGVFCCIGMDGNSMH